MKLKLDGPSIHLRLSTNELNQLQEHGKLTEQLNYGIEPINLALVVQNQQPDICLDWQNNRCEFLLSNIALEQYSMSLPSKACIVQNQQINGQNILLSLDVDIRSQIKAKHAVATA